MGSIVTTNTPVLLYLGISDTATANEESIVNAAILRAEAAVRRFLKYDPVQKTRTEYYPQMNLDQNPREGVWEADSNEAYFRYESSAITDELQVQHIPIRSVSSLYVDYDGRFGKRSGAFASDTLKTEGEDYWPRYDIQDSAGNLLCRDGIILSTGRWPTTPGSVKITYVAGYSASEFTGLGYIVDATPIYEAVINEAARRAKQAFLFAKNSSATSGSGWTAGSISGERLGDYSYSLGGSGSGTGGAADTMFGGVNDLIPESKERLIDFQNMGWILSS